MNPIVSEEERRHVAENFANKVEGTDRQDKIVDVLALAQQIQKERKSQKASMVIDIKSIMLKKNHETNKSITFVKDPNFNCVYGIFAGVDGFKNILWSRIEMSDTMRLNLDYLEDAKRWAVIRMHPSVKGSPFESDPIYEVNDPTIEAHKTQKRVTLIQQLFTLVNKMGGIELVETMRYLALGVDSSLTLDVARASLLDLVIKDPEIVYDKLSQRTRGIEGKLRSAIQLNIVIDNPEKGIIYNEIPLGINMHDAVDKLSKDKTLFESILASVEVKDIVAKNIQNEYVKSKTEKTIEDDKPAL